jgi:hypothetical protein
MFRDISEIQIVDTHRCLETLTSTGFAVDGVQFNRTLLGSDNYLKRAGSKE